MHLYPVTGVSPPSVALLHLHKLAKKRAVIYNHRLDQMNLSKGVCRKEDEGEEEEETGEHEGRGRVEVEQGRGKERSEKEGRRERQGKDERKKKRKESGAHCTVYASSAPATPAVAKSCSASARISSDRPPSLARFVSARNCATICCVFCCAAL